MDKVAEKIERPRRGEVLMRQPVVFDGRNVLDPRSMRELGFQYFGIGRPAA